MSAAERTSLQEFFVLRYNHFDPVWRRCWDRDFHDADRRFVSYRKIEQDWIDDSLETTKDGESKFMIEASWVLRHYLERRPQTLKTFRKLLKQGRFELMGAGENIIDVNMVHGELMVRNLVLGTLWAQKTLGERPVTGCHGDGFGSCAQLPQVFRGCGYDWVPFLSYNIPDAAYWRGLDGSTVLFEKKGRFEGRFGTKDSWIKRAPCPACSGKGCKQCERRGYVVGTRAEIANVPTQRVTADYGILLLMGEEIMPGLHVTEDIAKFNAQQQDFTLRQALYRDLRELYRDEIVVIDNPPADQISSKVENNPSSTGCYVTRIKIKQEHRAAEHVLLAAERWDTMLNGGANAAKLRDAWRRMTLSAFHDSITCSHIDAAYDELMDLLADVQAATGKIASAACRKAVKSAASKTGARSFTVFNSESFPVTVPVTVVIPSEWDGAAAQAGGQSVPVYDVKPQAGTTGVTLLAADVPALGAKTIAVKEAPAACQPVAERPVTCGRFTVEVGENGITAIDVQGIGRIAQEAVAGSCPSLVGELILENDIGDPWSTRSFDHARQRLSAYTKLESIERRGDGVVITYAGGHPSNGNGFVNPDPLVLHLSWRQMFHVRDGVPWIDVETHVRWFTGSRRLRIAFPSTTGNNRGVYGVPYGVIERARYEQVENNGNGSAGDWPTTGWAGVQAPDHILAILERGTPSYRIEDGVVTVSVLRSPQHPHCLLEPPCYIAYNYNGMMDHGEHVFHHAIYAAPGDWRNSDVVRQAAAFNTNLLVLPGALAADLPAWKLDAAHTQLGALKPAEDGKGIVVRLVETAGRSETVRLHAPKALRKAFVTNMLEEDGQPVELDGDAFAIEMKPWKIVTVRLTKK